MSATILLGVPRTILLGGTLAIAAATAITLKITQPKVTLPRAAVAAPAQPLDPTILHGAAAKITGRGGLSLKPFNALTP